MPEHFKSQNLFEAVENNDEESVKHFIEQEHVPVTSFNVINMTAAHFAACTDNLNILKYLVEKDASLVEMKDWWNQTALHMATRKGSLPIVKYLVESCNASIHHLSHVFQFNTVLHVAAGEGHLRVVEYFVEEKKLNVNELNSEGRPAVFLAAGHDHIHVVEYLMDEAKAEVMGIDYEGKNILHACVEYGYKRVPQFLLDQKKLSLDINARDNLGRSVLCSACHYQRGTFIKYLIEEKQANVNLADTVGWTPLHEVAKLGNLKLVKYLVKHGADIKMKDVNGSTALDLATSPNVTEYLKDAMQNRSRRSVVETFNPHLLEETVHTNLAELGPRAAGPTLYDIHFGLTLANVVVRLFKPSTESQSVQLSTFFPTPADILRNRINAIFTDVIDSVFSKKF